MCRPASFILTKDSIFWSRFTDSHEQIIEEYGLHADGAKGPNIVRVEITPPDSDMSRPASEWSFQVDQDILPKWWDAEDGEKRTRAALEEWITANVIREGIQERKEGRVFLMGNATVKAWGNATVKAGDNATVKAGDNATVNAGDNATVNAGGNATVKAWGNATVTALDNATVNAWGNATVKAWGNATVKAGDNATVEAWGNATVKAGDNATVKAWGNATVKALDNATVEAWGNATVTALDNATVEALDNATVNAGQKTTVIRWSAKAAVTLEDEAVLVDRSGYKPVCRIAEEVAHAES